MNKMRKTTLFQRILAKSEHATKLVDQRRALQDAIAKFQVGGGSSHSYSAIWNAHGLVCLRS